MSKTYSIGVDLGGTNLRVAAYADGTDFLESILIPTRLAEGRERVVQAGHIVVKDNGGAPCGCGGFGCLEQYA